MYLVYRIQNSLTYFFYIRWDRGIKLLLHIFFNHEGALRVTKV